MVGKKNESSAPVVAPVVGPVSDEQFLSAIENHLKSGDREGALAAARAIGIDNENTFNSRLSNLRTFYRRTYGVEIPQFRRGRSASVKDTAALAAKLQGMFKKAE